MGFKSSIEGPNVWLRPAIKPDGEEYYEHFLVYVDDMIAISHAPKMVMDQMEKYFKIKGDKVEPPEMYLRAKLKKQSLGNYEYWTMSNYEYV